MFLHSRAHNLIILNDYHSKTVMWITMQAPSPDKVVVLLLPITLNYVHIWWPQIILFISVSGLHASSAAIGIHCWYHRL